MASGDVVVGVNMRFGGLVFVAGTVTLDGSNPTPIQLSSYMGALLAGVACINGTGALGADPNDVSVVVNGTSLDVYAWKVTTGGASGNPTEIASTDNARLVSFFAIGSEIPSKGR